MIKISLNYYILIRILSSKPNQGIWDMREGMEKSWFEDLAS